jgi:hypothetical protein
MTRRNPPSTLSSEYLVFDTAKRMVRGHPELERRITPLKLLDLQRAVPLGEQAEPVS